MPRASSTVITPSCPTRSNASAMRSPIASSLLAEIVATCEMRSLPSTGSLWLRRCVTTSSAAAVMPRFTSIGLAPDVTLFMPALMTDWASTVAVVVPSPASSLVFDAASFSTWAPMLGRRSSNSISFATVTPSFVIVGAPKDFSSTTFRPFGPSVTLTAFAIWSTPSWRALRASESNLICFAMVAYKGFRSGNSFGSGSRSCSRGAGRRGDGRVVILQRRRRCRSRA
ncbi:hypothetical protein SARU107417_08175 [Salinibacter ruber]